MYEYDPHGSIEDAIDYHLSAQNTGIHEEQFEQLTTNQSAMFREIRHVTIGNVPIAVAQEPRAFTSTLLSLFLEQTTRRNVQPFALSISANYPEVENEAYEINTKANIKTLQKFNHAVGHKLPFSYFEQPYDPDTTIGEIRRDLLNASLLHTRRQYRHGRIPAHANLLIADVDTSWMSPCYMARPQAKIEQGYSFSAANKRYRTSNGEFPELDRAVSAMNLWHLISPRASYDCHAFYGLQTVLAGQGFDELDSVAETHYMRRRAQRAMGDHFVDPSPVQVPGAIAVSPPRRPFEKFRAGYMPHELWEPGKFGMQDAYREGIATNKDITKEMANRIVARCVGGIAIIDPDRLSQSILEEQGDLSYVEVREATELHLKRILEVADNFLDLRISDLSFRDMLERPLEELQ